MSTAWLTAFTLILALCCFICLYRVGRGPSAPDRMVAIDLFCILVVGFCALMAVHTGRDVYLNVAISWSLLGFIGTTTLAKYLEGKRFDE